MSYVVTLYGALPNALLNNTAGGSSPDVLQQVMVPTINRDKCNEPGWYEGEVTEQMICAGYEEGGKDSCQVNTDVSKHQNQKFLFICFHSSQLVVNVDSIHQFSMQAKIEKKNATPQICKLGW